MNPRDPGTDASFEWLRHAHRSEQAPEALRRRALERAREQRPRGECGELRARRWWSRGSWLALAAAVTSAVAVIAGVWLGASRSALVSSDSTPTAAGSAVLPTAEPAPRPVSAACPVRLPYSPWDPAETHGSAEAAGLHAQALETETAGCGPLTRRYLLRDWEAVGPSSPVLIVLHDAGESAEQAPIVTRWWFDDLAQRKFAVLVYANGGPITARSQAGWQHPGAWQTDAAAHPAVDDVAYLQAIVQDLQARHGLGRGAVFLAGYGSGAVMALAATLQHPDRYAGVAAFLPTRMPRKEELGAALSAPGQLLPPVLNGHRLGGIFVAQRSAVGEEPAAVAREWAALFGTQVGALRVTREKPGIRRIDAMLTEDDAPGGPRELVPLRIASLPEQVDPFPGPGGGERLVRAASEKLPNFFDGPGAAWDFFERGRP